MEIQDIVNQVLDSLERGDVQSNAHYYADNFTFSGPVPEPLNKSQFLDLMTKINQGVPDWSFNRGKLRVEGQTVIIPVQVTGTQTRTLPGLMPGMPDLPATNRSFRIPPETIRIKFQGERAVDIHVDPVPGGGIPGMLEQLGVAIPVTGRQNKPQK
jgi:predicted ester cyclase